MFSGDTAIITWKVFLYLTQRQHEKYFLKGSERNIVEYTFYIPYRCSLDTCKIFAWYFFYIHIKNIPRIYTSEVLWCQSVSHCYFCVKFIQNSEKIPDLFPLGKMLLSVGWKDSQEELNLELILREFFSPPFLKFAHGWQIYQIFSYFGTQNTGFQCCMLSYSKQPCGAILHKMFTIHGLTYANI